MEAVIKDNKSELKNKILMMLNKSIEKIILKTDTQIEKALEVKRMDIINR